jgi:hypothetical protein
MFNLSSHFESKQTDNILLLCTSTTKNKHVNPCHWSHHRPFCMPACKTAHAVIPVSHVLGPMNFILCFLHTQFKEGTRNFYLNALQLILNFYLPHLTIAEIVSFNSQTRRTPNKHSHRTLTICL